MKVSIVTISYNPGPTIKRTIDSILSQSFEDFEWIVIDSCSDDGSLQFYESVKNRINHFIVEKDKGISDAMNKGLQYATGDAIIYMNAGDDFFDKDSLKILIENWNLSYHEWIIGSSAVYSERGKLLYYRYMDQKLSPWIYLYSGCRILHASVVVNRERLIDIGGFDNDLYTSMDYAIWLKMMNLGYLPQMISIPTAKFYSGGISGNIWLRYLEQSRLRRYYKIGNPLYELYLAFREGIKHLFSGLKRYKWAYQLKEWLKI
jgi:glycosyltransferase involved in cell wall biosynthesis